MGRCTSKMESFARDIADTLNIELPTKTLEDGSVETDFSFEAISDFIDENKDDYYEERRLFG